MHFGITKSLRSGLLKAAGLAVALCAIAYAQNTTPAQSSPSTPPPAAWDPDYGPPRTAVPLSVQEPSNGQPANEEPGAAGQESSITADKDDAGRFVFKKQVQEVVLHATVVDDAGHLITGLNRGDFTIFVNNVPEPITSFRREDVPVAWESSSIIPAQCGTSDRR